MKYAAIIQKTIHHEGDKRSRTHPGHGYPAYSETVESLHKFKTKEEMLEWIKNRSAYEKYELIEYSPIKVKTTVEIIKEPIYREGSRSAST